MKINSLLAISTAMILGSSCSDDPIPIEVISQIIISDNANNGNASDIEVNFTKQYNTDQVSEYRILAIKVDKATNFSLDKANAVGPANYTHVAPVDIYKIKGKTLAIDTKDVDGDVINIETAYTFGILTVTNDQKNIGNSFHKDSTEFQLSNNNLVTNLTREFDGGAGSLSIDENGNIFMGDYNIHSHLSDNTDKKFPIYKIEPNGKIVKFSRSYSLLGGNAFDNAQNFYQSTWYESRIIKIDPNGVVTDIRIEAPDFRPDGIYFDANDNMFVTDQNIGQILKIDMSDGASTIIANVGENPRGIAGDEQGNLYISHNTQEGKISKVTSDGVVSTLATIPTYIHSNYPLKYLMWVGYLLYRDNYLYAAGMSTGQIYRISMNGVVEVFAGSGFRGIPKGDALTANFNRPMGLVFSHDGKTLFVSGCTDTQPQHNQYSSPVQISKINIVD
jgi:hypothetical protein